MVVWHKREGETTKIIEDSAQQQLDLSKESYVDGTIIGLQVSDLLLAIRWYEENFGLKMVSKGRQFATMSLGPGRILYLGHGEGQKGGVQFSTKHIEALRQNLQKNGVAIIENDDPNSIWFEVVDPFGNKLTVWSGDRFGVNKLQFVHTPDMELGWCKLESKGEFQAIGIRIEKTHPHIGEAIEAFRARLHELPHRANDTVFCVNPLEESFLYIGVEVDPAEAIPSGMVAVTVPAQDYAVIVYPHATLDFRETYGRKYGWLQGWTHLKKKPGDVYILEYFLDDSIESYLPYVDKE